MTNKTGQKLDERYIEWCKRQSLLAGFFFAVVLPIAVMSAALFPFAYWLAGGSW